MFRRIELVTETPLASVNRIIERLEGEYATIDGIEAFFPRRYRKSGLCFVAYNADVIEALCDLNPPRKRIGRN